MYVVLMFGLLFYVLLILFFLKKYFGIIELFESTTLLFTYFMMVEYRMHNHEGIHEIDTYIRNHETVLRIAI